MREEIEIDNKMYTYRKTAKDFRIIPVTSHDSSDIPEQCLW